jgi:hypothetical protein
MDIAYVSAENLMKKIRCIECYKQRPGGRCQFCPLARQNRAKYRSIGEGWFVPVEQPQSGEQEENKENTKTDG